MNELDFFAVIDEMLEEKRDKGLPDPEQVSYYALERERKIWIDLHIDETILNYERLILRWNMQDKGIPVEARRPIWIYLFNYGGSTDVMWSLVDVMAASQTPIYTVNMGQCASAAGLIFMQGAKRFMFKNAVLMIHEGSGAFAGDAGKLLDQTESYKLSIKRMKEYILSRTQIPPKLLNKKRSNDWELTAQECLEMGVCDAIIESLDEVI